MHRALAGKLSNMAAPNVLLWSYSSLSAFETCPKRYHLTKILKQVVEPQTAQTMWGNEVHRALENAVGGVEPLPVRFKAYQPIVSKIIKAPGQKFTEGKFGLTAGFKPTSFFAKDVWFRGVIDLQIVQPKVATAVDWKTGKVKTDGDQMKLFAAATFAQHPYLEQVKTAYVWLAHGKVTSETFTPKDVPVIWQAFTPRVQRMMKALELDRWPPNPSGLCKSYCPVGAKLCEFCGS